MHLGNKRNKEFSFVFLLHFRIFAKKKPNIDGDNHSI